MGVQGRILAAYGSLPVQIPTDQTVEVDQLFMLITLLSGQLEENIIIFIRRDVCLFGIEDNKIPSCVPKAKVFVKSKGQKQLYRGIKKDCTFPFGAADSDKHTGA